MPSSASELPCSLKREVRVLEKRLDDQFVMRRALEKALGYKPCAVHASSVNCIPEPTEELIKEIAVLELEVICLEKHLLTLYRKAFEQQLSPVNSACDAENNKQPARSFSGILSEASVLSFSTPRKHQPVQSSRMVLARKSTPTASTSEASSEKINIGRSHSSLLHRSVRVSPSANNLARALKPCHTSPLSFVEEGKCMEPGVVSLADILGTRVADHVPQTPNKISEDMIRCIAAIYIRLRDVPSAAAQHAFFPSPCSSFSSASGLSSKYTADVWSWSPRCRRESFTEAWQVQDNELGLGGGEARDSGLQYDSVIEVSALCKGDQRSADVKDMLRKYMSLVQLLESVDLGGMKNEEKLAFWINVHNAMMMHAHIEYGIPQSNSKRILLTKVSYIVSGQRVNAELIEYQILCCRAHSSGQWLRLLLHPKWKSGRDRDEELQGFAVDRPEPLVHFALSSGSYSDPVVRLYSPKSLFQQLEAAKEEHIRANVAVGVRGRGQRKIILPRALELYARDAGLGAQEVVAAVACHLPDGLRDAVRRSPPAGRARGGVEWKPHNLAFRYLLAKELVGGSPACGRQQLKKCGPPIGAPLRADR
ncbi:Electron transporter [Zea mays]|nr:Electron transporter [Zea mays]